MRSTGLLAVISYWSLIFSFNCSSGDCFGVCELDESVLKDWLDSEAWSSLELGVEVIFCGVLAGKFGGLTPELDELKLFECVMKGGFDTHVFLLLCVGSTKDDTEGNADVDFQIPEGLEENAEE